jgi:hypothetical protein
MACRWKTYNTHVCHPHTQSTQRHAVGFEDTFRELKLSKIGRSATPGNKPVKILSFSHNLANQDFDALLKSCGAYGSVVPVAATSGCICSATPR